MKRFGIWMCGVLISACASSPKGMVVPDVDEFVARDDRMQMFNQDASRITMIGLSSLSTRVPLVGREKREDMRRYYFENPRVAGLLEVTARQRKDGWEIVEMDVDYTAYTVQPRDWHVELRGRE